MLDLRPALPALFALAVAVLTAVVPFVVPLLRRVLGWHLTMAQGAIVEAAVKRGAGVAAQFLAANTGVFDMIPVHNAAVASGAEYVLRRLPDTLKALELTPDHVQEMVGAELARLFPSGTAQVTPVPEVAPKAAGGFAVAQEGRSPIETAAASTVIGAGALLGGAAARAAVMLGVLFLGAGALSACSTAQQAQALKIAQQACVIDSQIVPMAQPVVAALGGSTGAAIAGTDAAVVHPAVAAACAALGGKVVTVTTTAPAAAVTPAVAPVPTAAAAPALTAK